MIQNSHIIHALPLVADALGRKYGVKVLIGGQRAYTNGKDIHIPALPLDADETALNLARGYLDHEAAHLRITDFEALRQANLTNMEKHVWNILEDFMVEREMAGIYPGCARNFAWLIRHIFLQPAEHNAADSEKIFDWLLISLRSLTVPELEHEKTLLESAIDWAYPNLPGRIEPLVRAVTHTCADTKSCIKMAREFVKLLQEYSEAHPEYENSKQGQHEEEKEQLSGKNGQKQGKNVQTGHSGDTLSAKNGENTANLPAPKSSDGGERQTDKNKHGESDVEPQAENAPVTASKSETNPNNEKPTLKDILEDSSVLQDNDLGALAGKMLEDLGKDNANGTLIEVAVVRQSENNAYTAADIAEIRARTSALRTRITALMQSKVLCRNYAARIGKIDMRRIARLSVADSRIFAHRSEKQGVNTAVHILLDASYSMQSCNKINLACQACYAVAEALHNIPGIAVAVTSFPNGPQDYAKLDDASWATVNPILVCKQKFHNRFQVGANGTTPMAPALWWVLQQMWQQTEIRKILLILSDGEPDNMQEATTAIEAHLACGHEVYGIGIATTLIRQIINGNNSKVIFDLDELAHAMFDMLQPALLKGRRNGHENAI